MGTLHLVRHGQARFGSDDYDRLSELGWRQCQSLGAWLRDSGVAYQGVLRGRLRRQRESLEALAMALPDLPAAEEWPALDEYDSAALLRSVAHLEPQALPPPQTPQGRRAHFRLLRRALLEWMAGRIEPEGLPTWDDWVRGVEAVLDHVRQHFDGHVLLVSSGGPISTAVAQVLAAPPATVVELNLRLRNSALSELQFTPARHALLSFNTLPHLQQADRQNWITYA
jgi:broad specificity phosphatase PhoE